MDTIFDFPITKDFDLLYYALLGSYLLIRYTALIIS